ncbi:MAG: hypothetical protein JNL48_15280 [Acidobacteria bacterium]|nr:hypothetical protein [Acidobacteriota bacterium]
MRLFRRHLDTAALGMSLVEPPDRATAAHLESCARCRRERDRLATRLAATRVAARAAADAAFSPADLDRQRQSILERIGRLGAAARVLPFPAPAAPRPAPTAADRRWVLAAAAAGIILGIGVGRLPGGGPATPSPAPAPAARMATAEPAADPFRDDRLLSDVEELLTREIRPEFEALDGLTPITYEAR